MNSKKTFVLVVILLISGSWSCTVPRKQLKARIERELVQIPGDFAVAYLDIATGERVLLNEHESFHAASTMKTPVMIEVYKQSAEGMISLNDSITIKNEFKSIADGSIYALSPKEDSDTTIYKHLGEKRTVYDLLYDMIIISSNLATNIIIDLVGAKQVMNTMHDLGAHEIRVLRGVEDNKAFQKGMNNSVTAFDMMLIMEKLAKGEVINATSSAAMIDILLDQKFNDIIPAQLPKNVKVAHKTGWIKGIHHDAGIIILPDGRRYVLVLLSKNLKDEKAGVNAMANVSLMIYNHFSKN